MFASMETRSIFDPCHRRVGENPLAIVATPMRLRVWMLEPLVEGYAPRKTALSSISHPALRAPKVGSHPKMRLVQVSELLKKLWASSIVQVLGDHKICVLLCLVV